MKADRPALSQVIGAVIRQAVEDVGANGLMVLDAETADGRWVLEIAALALGSHRVRVAPPVDAAVGSDSADAEWARAAARIAARDANLLLANTACKTVLLLSRSIPTEPLLPLGDLYASAVVQLVGSVSVPDDVAGLVDVAGGFEVVDHALATWLEGRRPLREALSSIPADARETVFERLRTNRASRRWPYRVPKLSERTLWIDIHE
jgi:hypothetical protein